MEGGARSWELEQGEERRMETGREMRSR